LRRKNCGTKRRETASSGQTSNNPSQYAGGQNDGTGLQYNGDYYSPELQRFISEGAGGDNQYSYAGNNPVSARSPKSFLRDPFSVNHWFLNASSNSTLE
jgi:RHS repeat-associated protein